MTLGQLLRDTKEQSAANSIPYSDFLYLLSEELGLSIPELSYHQSLELNQETAEALAAQFIRLKNHEAPQYICGAAYFFGHRFRVNPSVLIPRPETEGLLEKVLLRLHSSMQVLEIGTGSGAIPISLKLKLPELHVVATDISTAALQVAKSNADALGADVAFIHADLFPATPDSYAAIISNPPYINGEDYRKLESKIRDQEPKLALYGGEDGLEYFRRILHTAKPYLRRKAFIAFEHGENQAAAIIRLAREAGFGTYEKYLDLSGRDRYLILQ